jgi:hypothetical protein
MPRSVVVEFSVAKIHCPSGNNWMPIVHCYEHENTREIFAITVKTSKTMILGDEIEKGAGWEAMSSQRPTWDFLNEEMETEKEDCGDFFKIRLIRITRK